MAGWACVARLGGIGDDLIAASPLRPLKRLGYKVEVITAHGAHVVFLNNPFIDKLTVKQDGEIPNGPEWQKWFASRAKEYDLFAHLSHSCEMRHGLFVEQTAFWTSPAYRRKLCAGSYLETAHDIVGVPHDFGPLYFPTDEEMDQAREVTKDYGRYAVWVVRGSRIDKVYPYTAMAIGRLTKELGIHVVLVGVGQDQLDMANQIKNHVELQNSTRDMVHIAMPQAGMTAWGIRPVLAAVFGADLVITPDTGVAWAVAMEPMQKMVLLSHASAENITKHWINTTTLHADQNKVPCWPCHRLHNDISTCVPVKDGVGKAASCISDISVETIVRTAARLWNRKDNVVPMPHLVGASC